MVVFIKTVPLQDGFLGGDWYFPATQSQINVFVQSNCSVWNEKFLSSRNVSVGVCPLVFAYRYISQTIFTPQETQLVFIIFVFGFCFWSFSSLLKYLGAGRSISLLGGLGYILTPIFFNYLIMGWLYILFFIMGMLPLVCWLYLRSLRENSVPLSLLTGIAIAISLLQPQNVIYLFLVLFVLTFFLILERHPVLPLIKKIGIMLIIVLLLTAYWLPGMLLFPDKGVIGSDIVMSDVSRGTSENMSPLNILLLWQSLFNLQYESVMLPLHLKPLGLIFALVAFSSTIFVKNKKSILPFLFVSFIPMLFYLLNQNRGILLNLPYANVIRDFGRTTTITTFSCLILFFLTISDLLKNNKKYLAGIFLFLWSLTLYPWFSGELFAWAHRTNADIRLRTVYFPIDYQDAEIFLGSQQSLSKALFLPIDGTVNIYSDPKFFGNFGETQDIFAGMSSVPGVLVTSDRSNGYAEGFVKNFKDNFTQDSEKVLDLTPTQYIVLRKNMYPDGGIDLQIKFNQYVKNDVWKNVFDSPTVVIYERKSFKPLITSTTVEDIQFSRITSTKYLVNLKYISSPIDLQFLETFSEFWQLHAGGEVISSDTHTLINGYANNWLIDPKEICQIQINVCHQNPDGSYDLDLSLEFSLGKYVHWGAWISGLSLLLSLALAYKLRRKNEN